MSWFSNLTGIESETPQSVKELLKIEARHLVSAANSRRFDIGTLTIPSLSDLRMTGLGNRGPNSVQEIVAGVQALHTSPQNAGAAFQVASQFSLLEMVGPSITPEDGVGGYEHDQTQGPACAIACGAGTIYRNYFVPVHDGTGQSVDRQIDCLGDVAKALNNNKYSYWVMENGYALPTGGGLSKLNKVLSIASIDGLDKLRSLLRIGVHSNTEVTYQNAGHTVTQLYCSAMPYTIVVGIRDFSHDEMRFGKEMLITYESALQVKESGQDTETGLSGFDQSWKQTEQHKAVMLQAKVPGRPSLDPYYFHISIEKTDTSWLMHWGQFHSGNATDDDRNHAPFYTTFKTEGALFENRLTDMSVITDSTSVHFCQHSFNGDHFPDADITSRIAKEIHLKKYSSKVEVSRFVPTDGPYAGEQLIEFTELDVGFGAPRHLLCGSKDAKISYFLIRK
jgi:hypothetical protein